MDFRLKVLLCLVIAAFVSAQPQSYESQGMREKRDVMESMSHAWHEVVKTFSDAGDAVVHFFKPTEKSVVTKMTDGVKDIHKQFGSFVEDMNDDANLDSIK